MLPNPHFRGLGCLCWWGAGCVRIWMLRICLMLGGDMLVTRRWQALCSANPRRLDRTQGVLPQARGERRADLRNKLVRMVQIVPANADDVPPLGLEVALALALAGK